MKRKATRTKLLVAVICLLVSLAVTMMPVAALESNSKPNVAIEQGIGEKPEGEELEGEELEGEELEGEELEGEELEGEELEGKELEGEELEGEELEGEELEVEELEGEELEGEELEGEDEENGLKNVPALMALRPSDVDITSDDTTAHKDDESKPKYDLPSSTTFVIVKQAKGNLLIWSVEAVEDESIGEEIIALAMGVDGSIKGDENLIFVSGAGSFNVGEMLGTSNWGTYEFRLDDETGEVTMLCDKSKVSHIDYITSKSKNPDSEPTEPKPTEPKPTEPKPTEPKPTEPKPTEPKPTEPKPISEKNKKSCENPKTGEREIYIAATTAIISLTALLSIGWNVVKRKQQ